MVQELKNFGVEMCAIVQRNGRPVIYDGIDGSVVDTYATLSATIVGASEVIYTTLGIGMPSGVFVRSEGGIFVGIPLGRKAVFAAVVKNEEALEKVYEYVARMKEVLESV